VTQQAEGAWVDAQLKSSGGIAKNLGGQDSSCTPGYYIQEGTEIRERYWRQEYYWGTVIEFIALLRQWREDGNLEGLQLN
jgi:cyclohexanone monooxygenase